MSLFDAAGALAGAVGGNFGPDVAPGAVAAWALTFYRDQPGGLGTPLLAVGSDTYDGSIAATMPDDLSGGSYEAVIEGMTDDDYAKIRLAPGERLAAELHLWWKDSPSGILGDLANFTGFTDPLGAVTPSPPAHSLVAVLCVDKLSRRTGERRYEVVVSMRERVFSRLDAVQINGQCFDDLAHAIDAIGRAAGITISNHMVDSLSVGPNDPSWASVAPGTALQALKSGQGPRGHALLDQLRDGLRAYGLEVALIRDGSLHVGKWNDRPLASRTVDDDSGLVAVRLGAPKQRDAAAGERPDGAPTARDTVTITTLGRPDIKPGDVVSVDLPPQDFPNTLPADLGSALLTSVTGLVTGSFADEPAGPPKKCLVGTVNHRLSRRAGFVTTVNAVVLASDDDPGWDAVRPSATPAAARTSRQRGSVPADVAQAAARAVHDVFRDISDRVTHRIGQIRRHPASTGSGRTPPRHTSEIWFADVAGDGMPAGAQRVAVTRDRHGEAREVPYLSPFAWGNYGLVLPRYPGTRVMLTKVSGHSDLVDIGALWARDGGPPSEAGDYWLVLPIGVTSPEDIGDGDGVPGNGPSSHDLIDRDGTRIVETKRFVIRVADQPSDCTTRPTPGDDAAEGSVLIETKSSGNTAQIVLKNDGSITVKGSSITFDTSGQGDITLNANNVKVNVTGTMDVS